MADFAQHLSEVLSCYFPDFHLKEEQRDVLEYLYEGRGDCLVSLPTGYGKSLLFQAAGPLLGRGNGVPNSSVLVLSPLNVIQRDQMLSMTKRGITCCRIDTKGRPWTYIKEDLAGDELRDTPVDLLESLESHTTIVNQNVDQIFVAANDESHPRTVSHGVVRQQDDISLVDRKPTKFLDPTPHVESLDLLDAIVLPELEPNSPPPMETQQNENLDEIFVVTEDGLSESWPLTMLQGVVFQHDDITQVDSSLLEEDPMKLLDHTPQVESLDLLDAIVGPEVEPSSPRHSTRLMETEQVDTPDEDETMWSPVTLPTTSEPDVDGSPPHLCTTSITEPQFYETEVSVEEVLAGKFTVILSHPEALLEEDGKRLLHSPAFGERIVALFVDECHTVEQWSNDFRTAFGKLHTLPAYFSCPIIGLSATITTASLEKLPPMMGMSSPLVIRVNPDKPNIFLERRTKPSNIDIAACAESIFKPFIDQLFEEGDDYPVTLLYMPVEWCSDAQLYACEMFGYPDLYTTPYVAIYSSQDTEVIEYATQELKSTSPHIRLIFCTSSVGMGFDSPCISRVVHAKPPRNIVDYVQQIGRAGRVGQPSTAILFFNASDIASNVKGIKDSIVQYCRTTGCLRQSMLQSFGFEPSEGSRNRCCSNCQ